MEIEAGCCTPCRSRCGSLSGCRAGQCERCSVEALSGTIAHLSPYDGEADRCLTCRAVPVRNVAIEA